MNTGPSSYTLSCFAMCHLNVSSQSAVSRKHHQSANGYQEPTGVFLLCSFATDHAIIFSNQESQNTKSNTLTRYVESPKDCNVAGAMETSKKEQSADPSSSKLIFTPSGVLIPQHPSTPILFPTYGSLVSKKSYQLTWLA